MIRNALSLVLASLSVLVSASGGCGTVVRNPGGDDDDAEKDAPSARAPTPVPPGESQENDGKGTGTSAGAVQAPDCKGTLVPLDAASIAAAATDAFAVESGLTLDVTIFRGTPASDVTSNYGFSLLAPKGNRIETNPFPLSLDGEFVLTVLKEKSPVCQNVVLVSQDDLARGGVWRLQITLP